MFVATDCTATPPADVPLPFGPAVSVNQIRTYFTVKIHKYSLYRMNLNSHHLSFILNCVYNIFYKYYPNISL